MASGGRKVEMGIPAVTVLIDTYNMSVLHLEHDLSSAAPAHLSINYRP